MAPTTKPAKPAAPVCRPLEGGDWPDVEALFGEKGACAGCWCMYWRQDNKSWLKLKGAANRRSLKALIGKKLVHAALAYDGAEPIGWCCVGPYGDFPRLEGARTLQRMRGPGTWSVVCFFIRADWRGKHVASALLGRAARLAFQRGAREIEGYPVVLKPGKTMPAAFAYTGTEAMFRAAAFTRVDKGTAGRAIYLKRRAEK